MAQEEEMIKSAVTAPEEGMQESIVSQQQAPAPDNYAPPQDYQQSYQDYSGYSQGYAPQQDAGYYAPSSDTISEISEQIVSEKMFSLKSEINKILELKTTFESRLDFLDQRLKRIEATIDKLQSAVLQKVGEFVNDVHDIKNEMIETQKSFKALHHK